MGKNENNSAGAQVQINYQSRDIEMISLSRAEIELLSELSLPFEICFGLSTTFLGASLGLFLTYQTTKPHPSSLIGYAWLTLVVGLALALLAYLLRKTNAAYKKKIIKK